jgi:hypothetical protein
LAIRDRLRLPSDWDELGGLVSARAASPRLAAAAVTPKNGAGRRGAP